MDRMLAEIHGSHKIRAGSLSIIFNAWGRVSMDMYILGVSTQPHENIYS